MPPMTPRPPALVTAAASSGPAATFILQENTCWESNHHNRTRNCVPGEEDRVFDAKILSYGSLYDRHSGLWVGWTIEV
jgi:hypothetical protein